MTDTEALQSVLDRGAAGGRITPDEALALYRDLYQPSDRWPRPHVMVGINLVAAGLFR